MILVHLMLQFWHCLKSLFEMNFSDIKVGDLYEVYYMFDIYYCVILSLDSINLSVLYSDARIDKFKKSFFSCCAHKVC